MKKQHGYILDAVYPPHFYRQLMPLWMSSQMTFLSLQAPAVGERFAYCELGCGVGLNLLLAAALHPRGEFVGVDFNPQHIHLAQQAARACEVDNVQFVQAGFAEFARDNRQAFDFIVSHGVWSWVAPQVQQQMLALVAEHLRPGGVLYLHYMCHPGATYQQPVQKFLHELAQSVSHSSTDAIKLGMAMLEQLVGDRALGEHVLSARHLQEIKRSSPAYWAHELLTDHWCPQHSVDVHRQVAAATSTRYLGSANGFDNLDPALSVPAAARGLLQRMPSPALAEMLKDLARNSRQRMDLFQRQPTTLSAQARHQHLADIHFTLLPGAPQTAAQGLDLATPIGPLQGAAELFEPLLRKLHSGSASFAELSQLDAFAEAPAALLNALQLLIHADHAHVVRADAVPATPRLDRLQQWLTDNALPLQLLAECATALHQPGRVIPSH